jgi:hypothetical protein
MLIVSLLILAASPLDSVREQFKGKKGFEVLFVQEIKQEIFPDQPSLAKGRVAYDRPSKLRWVYESPEKKEIVFEGGKAFVIRGGEKEDIPNARAIGVEESFGFLWGEMNLSQFKVRKIDASSVEIVPLHADKAQFEKMFAKVSAGRIEEVRVIDHLGGESLIRFSQWKFK